MGGELDLDTLKVHSDSDSESESESDLDTVEEIVVNEIKPTNVIKSPDDVDTLQEYKLQDLQTLPDTLQNNTNTIDVHQLFTKHLASSNNVTSQVESEVTDVVSVKESHDTNVSYNKMKVDELRKLAINSNKLTESEAKKMKKPDLVALLTNDTDTL